ncbi:DUF3971 domain-containing protein [Candidatus Puniceispirillum sp.]|nr:DUF3971 domain-containing protein [Candidatus Puniceispirillum sp.]
MSAQKRITVTGILKALVITFTSLVIVVASAGYLYVNEVGGLSRLLETELATMVGSGTATVGDARISVSLSRQPIQLTASDLVITLDSEQINLPRADMGFGWTSVLGGRPETIFLRGVKLDLVKKSSGWSGSPAILFLDRLAKNANQTRPNSTQLQNTRSYLGGVKLIAIETDRLSLSHENRALPDLVFENIYIDVTSGDSGEVSGSMRASRINEARDAAGSFTLSFDGWPGSKSLKIDLSASELQTTGISGYIDGLPASLSQVGALSGHVAVEMENSILTSASADVTLTNGILSVPGIHRNAAFNSADLIFAYDMALNDLTVSKAELEMADNRQLSFIGTVEQFHSPSSIVVGIIEAKNLPVQALLDDWPDAVAPHLNTAIKKRFNGGHFKMVKVGFEGVFQSQTSALDLLKLDLESKFSSVRVNLSNGQYQRLVATIDGDLDISVGKDGVQKVLVDLNVKDGSMLVAGYELLDVPSGQMKSVMRDGKVELEHLELNLGSAGRFDLKGVLKMNDALAVRDLKLRLNVPDMDVPLFSALWPSWAASKTRDWVVSNITAGRVRASKLSIAADLGAAEGVQNVYDVEGDVKVRNAHLTWSENTDDLTNIDADLYWNNDEFSASILKGGIGSLSLKRGRVVVAPVLARVEKDAHITLTAKGGMSDALNLARQVGLSKYGSFDFNKIEAGGEIEFSLEAILSLGKKVALARRIKTLDATVSNGIFRNLPNSMNIKNAELVINIARENSQITGTANVYGAPSEFSLDMDHIKGHVDLVAQAPPSGLLADAVAQISGIDIAGAIGGKIAYSGDPLLREARIGLTADLRGTSINIPKIGWAKLPAEDGRAIMTITLRNGQITSLQNIDMAAGSLSARGQVAFGLNGQVQAAFFERVAWPGNDLRDLIVEQNAAESWKVGATAKLVNLVPLRRNEGVSGGETLIFDFTADRIVVDDDITLSGQLSGKRDSSGLGNAKFLGMLSVHGKPLITEADMKIRFGSREEMITGTGLIGGGEASLTFKTSTNAAPKLMIVSENAGRVLSGLKVTDTVRGGKLWLTNTFEEGDFRSYDTTIELAKFRVVEAPRALRAFSVLSLAGLYSLVEGDGTAFQRGHAVLETRGPIVKISSMRASGEAVGVTMLGVFDRTTKKIDVSGNLVPVNQISKMIARLPLLGDLITGIDKSGIFVTQFKVTGTSDDMKTSVNPVTSVAPGLIRDLFSPNWLGSEEQRLFGPDKTEFKAEGSKQKAKAGN